MTLHFLGGNVPIKIQCNLRGSPILAAWELSLGFMLGEKAFFFRLLLFIYKVIKWGIRSFSWWGFWGEDV